MVSLESYLGVRQGRIWGRGGPVPVWEEGRPVTASELEGWRGSMNRIDFREFPHNFCFLFLTVHLSGTLEG